VAGAGLANPISVAAQAIKTTDLLGAWMNRPEVQVPSPDSVLVAENIWVFRADSTYVVHTRWNGVYADTADALNRGAGGHWTLQGDTLSYFNIDQAGRRSSLGSTRVARQGDRLITNAGSPCADTLRLVDEAKLPPPSKPPITVDPAALAGTWARSVDHSDTLVLGADKTARVVAYFDPPRRFRATTGQWALYPGNTLGVTRPNDQGKPRTSSWRIVTDQGKPIKLTRGRTCNDNPSDVYKRVSP